MAHRLQLLTPVCRFVLAVLGVVSIVACSSSDDDAPDGGDAIRTVTIGEGDDDGEGFTELVEGGDAHLHYGTQGGFHLFIAVRVTGFDERRLVVEVQAWRDDLDLDLPANQLVHEVDLEPVGPDGALQTIAADRLILCPNPTGIGSVDKTLRLSMTARDSFHHEARRDVTVVTRCPEGDGRCPPTCAGD